MKALAIKLALKNDEICKKHVTTCNDFHTTNDVKRMRKQFSRRRSVDRGKRDENTMKNQDQNIAETSTSTHDVLTMNNVRKGYISPVKTKTMPKR